ncbi:MAG TPA: class I SAM-dependent methyltransferase [Steroidobacteraceae bacterium]|nr:class I SAM-dependent methyltransferase [Steroidobacteraceae bacterium]
MDHAVAAVLAEYDARAAAEESLMPAPGRPGSAQVDELLLRVGPDTGSFMNLLIRNSQARSILEIGTSYGYSTLWLAEAARATGGRVVTLEMHARKAEYARERLTRAGLAQQVEFRLGDARESLATLAGPFDFVLLDLWKDLYVPCFDLFHPKLAPGACIVADNMLYPEMARPAAALYRRHVRRAAGISTVLLPIGSGLEVSRFGTEP